MKFLNIVNIELYKIFRKPRTYIAFGAVAAIVGLIQLGFYADGDSYMQFGLQSFTDSFDIQGNIMNGYLMAYIILQLLLVHVPLLVALVAGDMISGEAAQGTLRVLLTKPIRRSTLILAKFTASGVYTIALLLWMAVWALGISMLVFGVDDMLILKSDSATQIMASDVMWRYLAAFVFAAIALLTVSALSFFPQPLCGKLDWSDHGHHEHHHCFHDPEYIGPSHFQQSQTLSFHQSYVGMERFF